MIKQITKREAKKLFFENKSFYLCPCKMRFGFPWNPECEINPFGYWEDIRIVYGKKSPCDKIVNPESESFDNWEDWQKWLSDISSYTNDEKNHAWESMYNNWSYYNTNYEMGYYAHYYVKS